jgi:hypothetical protein
MKKDYLIGSLSGDIEACETRIEDEKRAINALNMIKDHLENTHYTDGELADIEFNFYSDRFEVKIIGKRGLKNARKLLRNLFPGWRDKVYNVWGTNTGVGVQWKPTAGEGIADFALSVFVETHYKIEDLPKGVLPSKDCKVELKEVSSTYSNKVYQVSCPNR